MAEVRPVFGRRPDPMAARKRPRRRDQPAHRPRGPRQGTRLFPDTGPDIALDLVDSRTDSKGVTIQFYRPAGRPQYRPATAD